MFYDKEFVFLFLNHIKIGVHAEETSTGYLMTKSELLLK